MKRIVWIFGLILGSILVGNMIYTTTAVYNNPNFSGNKIVGFAALIIVFSLVIVGIKHYRDKYLSGTISFGKAFLTGLYISLIATTLYVGVWLIEYYVFIPDFVDKYAECSIRSVSNNGGSEIEIAEATKQMTEFKEMYKSPFFVIISTYGEVLPIGILISLIGAFVFKRKPKNDII
jgi:hypothetical protein